MASTVLPNGIIIPEKFSRDWYADLYHNWQELDNLLGGGTPKDGTLTIQKNGTTVGTFSANQATDETINIEVPDVNNGTLTIQQNGTTVDTFTANSSSDKTVNIQCVDLTNNQTVGGNKEFTGTTTAHDVIPSAAETYNFGSPSYQWNNAYIKSLTINGVACGDILTHNVSEFVGVSGNQTISGDKEFNNISASDTLKAKKYINFNDNSNIYISGGRGWNLGGQISLFGKDNVTRDDSGNIVTDGGDVVLRCPSNLCGNFDVVLNVNNSIKEPQFSPTHNKINLGTSTNKWKTFNGLNPGALSLPSRNYISLDTTGFDVTATTIGAFTSTVDGWAILSISQKNKPFGIWILQGSYRVTYQSVYHQGDYLIFALIPATAGLNLSIYCTADDIDSTRKVDWLRVFPCQGNV